jgi:protein TonB
MPTIRKPLVFVPRWNIDPAPPIDVSSLVSRPGDFPTSTMAGSGESGPVRAGADSSGALWNADQVERQAALAPGSLPPRYPESLRSAGVEGEVVAVFVVDESGRAEQSGVRFVRSDNRLFEEAVRAALGAMRFAPAEVGGRKVRQLVQMPFVFTLRKY